MATFLITNIKWDAAGIPLPTTMVVEISERSLDDEDFEDQLGAVLTDMTGFCHTGFSYSIA